MPIGMLLADTFRERQWQRRAREWMTSTRETVEDAGERIRQAVEEDRKAPDSTGQNVADSVNRAAERARPGGVTARKPSTLC
jgi:hypothetical protein